MAPLKLYTASYKWVRTIVRTSSKPLVSPFSLLTLDGNRRTLKFRASLTKAVHVRANPGIVVNQCCALLPPLNDLGFAFWRRRHGLCSFSSSEKVRSSSAGSDIAADMGRDNGVNTDKNDCGLIRDESPSPSPPTPQQQQQDSKLLTVPTILTLCRVSAVPLLVSTFYMDNWWGRTATLGIFVAAAITDWLDGYIARKMKLSSAFGAFLDPVADKLMVATTLILLCSRTSEVALFGQIPWVLTVPSVAIIGREITMSAVREWAASQTTKLTEAVAVNNLGKWKTATQMMTLTILLATRDSRLDSIVFFLLTGIRRKGRSFVPYLTISTACLLYIPEGLVAVSGVVLLYISAGLSIWSLAVYMGKIWKVLLK